MRIPLIDSKESLVSAVSELGILPFFRNPISGFSIAEHVSPKAWFSDEDGVWEWKGPVIRETGCAYGKLFAGKAVFVSREWFPDLANYRRDGYDFDARFDDGLASFREQELWEYLDAAGSAEGKHIKAALGYGKTGKKGFDTLMTGLQSRCYVLVTDFVYETAKDGKPYGWGVAEYDTPEHFFGDEFRKTVYSRTPEESGERIFRHLQSLVPDADEKVLRRWMAK